MIPRDPAHLREIPADIKTRSVGGERQRPHASVGSRVPGLRLAGVHVQFGQSGARGTLQLGERTPDVEAGSVGGERQRVDGTAGDLARERTDASVGKDPGDTGSGGASDVGEGARDVPPTTRGRRDRVDVPKNHGHRQILGAVSGRERHSVPGPW